MNQRRLRVPQAPAIRFIIIIKSAGTIGARVQTNARSAQDHKKEQN